MTDISQFLPYGGVVGPDHFLVERTLVKTVLEALTTGGVIYLLGPHQVGKSSLMRGIEKSLTSAPTGANGSFPYRSVWLDMSIETRNVESREFFFRSLVLKVSKQFKLSMDFAPWWDGQIMAGQSRAQVMGRFFGGMLPMMLSPNPTVIFIDEIEAVAQLDPNVCEDLLMVIRNLWQGVSTSGAVQDNMPLFCFSGSHPPESLVSNPMATPFNAGRSFLVGDFSEFEANQFLPLLTKLFGGNRSLAETARRVAYDWCGGQPRTFQYLLYSLFKTEPTFKEPCQIKETLDEIVQDTLDIATNPILPEYGRCQTRAAERDDPGATRLDKLRLYKRLLDGERILFEHSQTQINLRLAGLVRVVRDESRQCLAVRSPMVAKWFSKAWVEEMITGLLFDQKSPALKGHLPEGVHITETIPGWHQDLFELDEIERIVEQVFCGPEHQWKRTKDPVKSLIPGMLFQCRMTRKEDQQTFLLKIYWGLGPLGGEIWRQEARALIQLSSRRAPGLPESVDADYQEDTKIGFLFMPDVIATLDNSKARAWFQKRPALASRELIKLMKGMDLLQEKAIFHRNLYLGTISVLPGDQPETYRLGLSGMEMSNHISSMLRSSSSKRCLRLSDRVRHFFRSHGVVALAGSPPERLERLFPDTFPEEERTNLPLGDIPQTDVFSMGIIAAHLLANPLPEQALSEVLREDRFQFAAYRRYLEAVRETINASTHIPFSWRQLLLEMIQWNWRERPTFSEILNNRDLAWPLRDGLSGQGQPVKKTFLVTYTPAHCGPLLKTMNYDFNETSEEGKETLQAIISEDIRHGCLAWFEEGFSPFKTQADERHARTKVVILGTSMVYFSSYHRPDFEDKSYEQALHIRYFLARDIFKRFEVNLIRTPLPRHALFPSNNSNIESENMLQHPSWLPMVDELKAHAKPAGENLFLASLANLVDIEVARLESRIYAVSWQTNPCLLTLDPYRDRDWMVEGLRPLFSLEHHPPLHIFFDFKANPDKVASVVLLPNRDSSTRPWFRAPQNQHFHGEVTGTEMNGILRVAWSDGRRPAKAGIGWLALEEDVIALQLMDRQKRGVAALHDIPELISQLRWPRRRVWLPVRSGPWENNLDIRTHDVFKAIAGTFPFFAIQGPPGTGKSTMVAQAIVQALQEDVSQRILVSAQSHSALDHLVKEIRQALIALSGEKAWSDLILLRHATDFTEIRVDNENKDLLEKNLFIDRQRGILSGCDQLLRRDEEGFTQWRKEIDDWRGLVKHAQGDLPLELGRRWVGGANIVFSTTNSISPDYLQATPLSGFDWVIVEEAAKATPTEILQPLVLGDRWLLVGDHKQLPPFSSNDLKAALDRCEGHYSPRVADMAKQAGWHRRTLDMFRCLFEPSCEEENDSRTIKVDKKLAATRQLTLQFRMRETISGLISKYFYSDNPLQTAETAESQRHGLTRVSWLRDKSLVWLDTSSLANKCGEQSPKWSNPAEGQLIKNLLRSLCGDYQEQRELSKRLAILSPYRRQVSTLKAILESTLFKDCAHTVDSFQGKQADIVILSLVRNNLISPERRCALGFLMDDQRVNVLLSRARCLLILVGAGNCFKNSEKPDATLPLLWNDFQDQGLVVNAAKCDLPGLLDGI